MGQSYDFSADFCYFQPVSTTRNRRNLASSDLPDYHMGNDGPLKGVNAI